MSIRNGTLFSFCLLILAACHVDSVNTPTTDASAGLKPSFSSSSTCPAGYECVNPNSSAPIAADLDTIGTNCTPESGCPRGTATYTGLGTDVTGYLDAVFFSCSNGQNTMVTSDRGCWDCKWGCAGASCPPGAQCITLPGRWGSDCTQVYCNQGYEAIVWWDNGTAVPKCWRAVTVAPPPPVTTATTVNLGPNLTWDPVSGAAGYRVYRQLSPYWNPPGQTAPEVWYTWLYATSYYDQSTDVSGDPQSQPDPAWGNKWVRYHVVSLSANGTESAYVNVHYYYLPNGGPY